MIALLPLLLQAATPPSAPPERFSILYDSCPAPTGNDVVVCGSRDNAASPRLPLREYRGPPDRPTPSNPYLRPDVALNGAAIGLECGAYGENCPVGGGGYAIPALLGGIVTGIGNVAANAREARARAADGTRRQPIDLGATGPAGHLEP